MTANACNSPPASPMNEDGSPQADLLNALSALFQTSRFSDITITCGFRQWAVHKAVVCSRSGFFDAAISSGQFIEATSGVIDLSDDDEDAVEQMIHFLYYLDYLNEPQQPRAIAFRHRKASDDRRKHRKKVSLSHIEDPLLSQAGCYVPEDPLTPPASLPCSPANIKQGFDFSLDQQQSPMSSPETQLADLDSDSENDCNSFTDEEPEESETHLLLHTRVYAIAEKYDIPSLKQLAKSKFEMEMACYFDSPEFSEAVEEVYCTTIDSDRGLRDVVLQAFKNHPQLANAQDVYAVIQDTPSLALDLFKLERGVFG